MMDELGHFEAEELFELGEVDTTITGLDMFAADWVEQGQKKLERFLAIHM